MVNTTSAKRVRAIAIALAITFATNYAISYAAKPSGSNFDKEQIVALSASSMRSGGASGPSKPAPPPSSGISN